MLNQMRMWYCLYEMFQKSEVDKKIESIIDFSVLMLQLLLIPQE